MSGPTLQNLPSGPGKSGPSFIKMQINLISLEISEMMRKCFKVHVFAIQVLALVKLGRYVQSKNSYDSFSFHFALNYVLYYNWEVYCKSAAFLLAFILHKSRAKRREKEDLRFILALYYERQNEL